MAYITPIHPPSGVRNAIQLNLRAPDEDILVLARSTRLELYTINTTDSEHVLQLFSSTRILGRVTTLNKFRPAKSSVDHLFVGTDLSQYFLMHWNEESGTLITTSEPKPMNLFENNAQRAEIERSTIDPRIEYMIIETFEGIIKTLPLVKRGRKTPSEHGHMGTHSATRIPELNVKDSCFVQRYFEKKSPRLALLWIDHEDRPYIGIKHVNVGNGDDEVEYNDLANEFEIRYDPEQVDYGASHLIPIKKDPYGFLILGSSSISYFDDKENSVTYRGALQSPNTWATWTSIDNQRYLLADAYGGLWILMIEFDQQHPHHETNSPQFIIKGHTLDSLGQTSQASCLIYLGDAMLFVGSHQGDSKVIRIEPQKHSVVQTIPNLGPILDFTVMDMGNRTENGPGSEFSTGQARIVTGSGAWVDGSLRSVRSGVGLQELGLIEDLDYTTNIFGVLLDQNSPFFKDTIFVSSVNETKIYQFDQHGSLTEFNGVEDYEFVQNQETLFAGNIDSARVVVQVTKSSIYLHELFKDHGKLISTWNLPQAHHIITAISVKNNNAVISIDGKSIISLSLSVTCNAIAQKNFDKYQISCVHLTEKACLVGAWNSPSVSILDKTSLQEIRKIKIHDLGDVIPRSILVSKLSHHHDTLLVSMADGHVVTFDLDQISYQTSQEKATILGAREADMYELPPINGTGLSTVFISSEHPTLVYEEGRSLAFSAIQHGRVDAVCPFDGRVFPENDNNQHRARRCIAVASEGKITFANIDPERITQVQPLPLNSTVRRLFYAPNLKAFGVGTISREIKNDTEITESTFRLLDEVMLTELDSYKLNQSELIESIICVNSEDESGNITHKFIIATSLLDDSTSGDFRGRLLVLEVTEERKLQLVYGISAKSCCRCLGQLGDFIVVAFDRLLVIYSVQTKDDGKLSLQKVVSTRIQIAVADMVIERNQIILADLIKSISIIEYQFIDGEHKLHVVARHFGTVWSTAVGIINRNPDTYLLGEAEGNLLILEQNTTGLTAQDKRRLVSTSEFRLGELVNRIRPINVAEIPNSAVHPRAFLATVEGSLYLFGVINKSCMNLLISLQANMAQRIISPGDISFNTYRAFRSEVRNEDEPKRFVDGEFLEKFLEVPVETQKACLTGILQDGKQVTVEEVVMVVTSLKRLR